MTMWITVPPFTNSGKTVWKKWQDKRISILWVCVVCTTDRCREPRLLQNRKQYWNVCLKTSVVCWRSMWIKMSPPFRRLSYLTRKYSTFIMPDWRCPMMSRWSGVMIIMAIYVTSLRRKNKPAKVETASIITYPIGDVRTIIFGWVPSARICSISRWNWPMTVVFRKCGYWMWVISNLPNIRLSYSSIWRGI